MAKQTWVGETAIEKQFQALCEKHSDTLNQMWNAVKLLSDSTGVPVGPYVPDSFKSLYTERLDPEFVIALTGSTAAEEEFWYSSSANC